MSACSTCRGFGLARGGACWACDGSGSAPSRMDGERLRRLAIIGLYLTEGRANTKDGVLHIEWSMGDRASLDADAEGWCLEEEPEAIASISPPSPDADRARALVEALERGLKQFDATSSMCPFNKHPTPPKDKPCPTCGAERSEGCRREITGAFGFVYEARQALKTKEGE